jgi:hypothetical protein
MARIAANGSNASHEIPPRRTLRGTRPRPSKENESTACDPLGSQEDRLPTSACVRRGVHRDGASTDGARENEMDGAKGPGKIGAIGAIGALFKCETVTTYTTAPGPGGGCAAQGTARKWSLRPFGFEFRPTYANDTPFHRKDPQRKHFCFRTALISPVQRLVKRG